MSRINLGLTNSQFAAMLADAGHSIGGIPFVFDAKSPSGKRFLRRLKVAGLSVNADEVSKAIAKFFEEGNEKWNVSVVRFTELDNGQLEVGLSPDDLAIGLSRQMFYKNYSFSDS